MPYDLLDQSHLHFSLAYLFPVLIKNNGLYHYQPECIVLFRYSAFDRKLISDIYDPGKFSFYTVYKGVFTGKVYSCKCRKIRRREHSEDYMCCNG